MLREELLAPEKYNLVQEVEKFAQEGEKLALIWESEQGEKDQVTYQE
ncbi:MAG: hypothetical protein IE909_15895, partial [Campylobacterales bacterium]|nr:hypothetical protein [Campylobacterales bacterium]